MTDGKKLSKAPLTVKGRTFEVAQGPTKMGVNVPLSTVDFFKDVRKPLIRSSPMSTLCECPRKFLYIYKLGITPKTYDSALSIGTMVHKMLQGLVVGLDEAKATATVEAFITRQKTKLIDAAGPDGFLPNGKDLKQVLDQADEDYHKARAMALVFWSFRPFDTSEWEILKDPEGTPMVEVVLEASYPGLSRPIRTPCDLALVKKGTNEVWIWDYKTTSFDPKKRAIPTKFSPQLMLYRLVLQAHLDSWVEACPEHLGPFPGYRVVGSLHAIIKKPGIKYCPKTKDKAGFHHYVERLVEWYKEAEAKDPQNPPMILDPHRFNRTPMTPELWGRLKEYCAAANAAPDVDHFYRAGENVCFKFNRVCSHMQLCNSDPSMWPEIVRNAYEISFREDDEDQNQGEDT